MTKTNVIFISFALKDTKLRDQLLEQLNKEQTSFSFIDNPIKQSWEPSWKEECQKKVMGCDGVIALVTNNVAKADGQLWELRCAYDSKMPVLLLHGNDENLSSELPEPVGSHEVEPWAWPTISAFINRL